MATKAKKRSARTKDSATFSVVKMGWGHGVWVRRTRYDHVVEVCIFSMTGGARGESKRRCTEIADELNGVLDREMGRDVPRPRSFAKFKAGADGDQGRGRL